MSHSRPTRHSDGRNYATFFDLPRECRDPCDIEYLQSECGDAICKPDQVRPVVANARPFRTLNRTVCSEFDSLVCMWARGIRCTVKNLNFGSLITCMNKLDEDVMTALQQSTTPRPPTAASDRTPQPMHLRIDLVIGGPLGDPRALRQNLIRWLNRFNDPNKRGGTWRISYEISSYIAGIGISLAGFRKEAEVVASSERIPSPLSTWHCARRAMPTPWSTVMSGVSHPPSAKELVKVIHEITQYNLRAYQAERRAVKHRSTAPYWNLRKEFDALRRSRQSGDTWEEEYADMRAEAVNEHDARASKLRNERSGCTT
ncbi:hypothetical protein LTR95_011275 [Oleoguttula sp. CCFEE 5521]